MMARYRRRYYSSRRRSKGHEKALEHIREAQALSRELGGTDKDVKKYFFSLSESELKVIFDKYERENGRLAREYAEETLPKWRSGQVHMSGKNAARIFKLLPPFMPIEKKFQLVESLWKHVGPSSNKTFYFGKNVQMNDIVKKVKAHLSEVVINYNIPVSLEGRFNWLAQGDVEVKQKLLNHFRQQEKNILSEALRTKLPVLIDHLQSSRSELTNHVAQTLTVGKHEVRIEFSKHVDGITDKKPYFPPKKKGNNNIIWWVIGLVILYLLMMSG